MFEDILVIVLAIGVDRLTAVYPLIDPFIWYRSWAESVMERLGGSRLHGALAAVVALGPIALLVLVVRYALGELWEVLRFVFDVIVLAWCLDLYRMADRAQEVADALKAGDLPVAGEHLRSLTGHRPEGLNEGDIARSAIESVLRQCNSVVVAPIFWFVLLGPVGAVVQRAVALLDQLWARGREEVQEFGAAVARLEQLIGWIPARITAISYGIMGSFEDALRCWRYQAGVWSDSNSATLLASGLGALQLQSCEGLPDTEGEGAGVSLTTVVPDATHVQRGVALVWRVLLFWLGLALLVVLTNLFGW